MAYILLRLTQYDGLDLVGSPPYCNFFLVQFYFNVLLVTSIISEAWMSAGLGLHHSPHYQNQTTIQFLPQFMRKIVRRLESHSDDIGPHLVNTFNTSFPKSNSIILLSFTQLNKISSTSPILLNKSTHSCKFPSIGIKVFVPDFYFSFLKMKIEADESSSSEVSS